MTPKEKAKELFEMFYSFKPFKLKPDSDYSAEKMVAKKQAQLCVDEILIACNQIYDSDMVHFKETAMGEWWLKVKQEIELM